VAAQAGLHLPAAAVDLLAALLLLVPPRSTRRCRRERRRRWDGRAVQLVLRAAAPAGAAVHRHLCVEPG